MFAVAIHQHLAVPLGDIPLGLAFIFGHIGPVFSCFGAPRAINPRRQWVALMSRCE
jgi:hypothetical protein